MTLAVLTLAVLLVAALTHAHSLNGSLAEAEAAAIELGNDLATALDDLESFQGLYAHCAADRSQMQRDHDTVNRIMQSAISHALAGREDDALACINELHTRGGA